MNQVLAVRVLERGRNLFGVRGDLHRSKLRAFEITLAERTVGGILHHQIGSIVLNAKFQDRYNKWMCEPGDSLCFCEKLLMLITSNLHIEYFNSCRRFQRDMLAIIDIGEATLA